jgi:hypothetical protein
MRRTQHDPTPHAQHLPGVWDTTRQHLDPASDDVAHRHALAAFVKVALAVQTRAIQRARAITQAAPEIRAAKVEAARRALREGTLIPGGHALAEALLRQPVRNVVTPEGGGHNRSSWVSSRNARMKKT